MQNWSKLNQLSDQVSAVHKNTDWAFYVVHDHLLENSSSDALSCLPNIFIFNFHISVLFIVQKCE